MFVVDVPGVELVVDGVDPRALMILDAQRVGSVGEDGERDTARLFVYQRNVERAAGALEAMEDELSRALERDTRRCSWRRIPTSRWTSGS